MPTIADTKTAIEALFAPAIAEARSASDLQTLGKLQFTKLLSRLLAPQILSGSGGNLALPNLLQTLITLLTSLFPGGSAIGDLINEVLTLLGIITPVPPTPLAISGSDPHEGEDEGETD